MDLEPIHKQGTSCLNGTSPFHGFIFVHQNTKPFVFYSMKAARLNVSVMSSKAEAIFISTGYSNWRKATV